MWHVMNSHDLIFIESFCCQIDQWQNLYVNFKQRRCFVPFALILEFLVSCVTDGFESMALTPDGSVKWWFFVGAELHPETPEVFFHDPKKSEPSFFFKKLGKTSFGRVLPLTQAGKTVLLTLVFVGGWGVGPVVAMVAILKMPSKWRNTWPTDSFQWNGRKNNIYFLLKPQKALGFWQTKTNTWGANLFGGNWSWGKASKDHKKRSDLS